MARRRLWAGTLGSRLQEAADAQGMVWIRCSSNIYAGGSEFVRGRVYKVAWRFAAQLIGGAFAELVRPTDPDAQPSQEKDASRLTDTLRTLDRVASSIERR